MAYGRDLGETGTVRGFVAIVVMLTAVRVQAQPAPSATTVLANVERYYAGTKQLSTSFRQYVTNATFHTTSTADGSLWLLRPGSYRFDYLEKGKADVRITRSVIDDGTTRWVIDHDRRQMTKNPGPNPALTMALSFFEPANLSTRFDVVLNPSSRFGRADSVVLELTPKQASVGMQLTFVVSTADWHVSESIVIDGNGNTDDFTFNATNLTRPVKATWFQAEPSGVLRHYRVVTPSVAPPTSPTPQPTNPTPPAARPAGPTP